MDFTALFSVWIAGYTIIFCVLPIGMCIGWYKKRSSDGFSSVTFSFVATSISLWLAYAMMLEDKIQMFINGTALFLFTSYLVIFSIYQTERRNITLQAAGAITFLLATWWYVSGIPGNHEARETLGRISSTFQMISFAGLIYEIFRVLFLLKTTEYLALEMVLGGFLLNFQWWVFGILTSDVHIQRANVAGLAINAISFGLYFPYPPKTWNLPWDRKIRLVLSESEKKKD